MNTKAERHLSKAEGYLAKGEENYRKAALEMRAAKDEGATWTEIGDSLGRSDKWCQKIVSWAETPANQGSSDEVIPASPFARSADPTVDRRNVKMGLANMPLEHVEQIISELPPDRQRVVAAAAGDKYLKARQDLDEEEQRRTPAERSERVAAGQAITEAGRRAAAGFLSLGIAGHLEQATEELRELVADGSVTPQNLEPITAALRALIEEYEVACAMAGLESDLEVAQR